MNSSAKSTQCFILHIKTFGWFVCLFWWVGCLLAWLINWLVDWFTHGYISLESNSLIAGREAFQSYLLLHVHSVGEQTEAQNDFPKAMQLVGSTKWTKSLTSESVLFIPYHAITFCSPHFYAPPFHSKRSDSCSVILLPSLAFREAIPTPTMVPTNLSFYSAAANQCCHL